MNPSPRLLLATGLIVLATASTLFAAVRPLKTASSSSSDKKDLELLWQQEYGKIHDQRMQWWREARFGMFIHWGVYSIPAGTWDGKQIPSIGEWIMNQASIPVD